MNAISRKNEKSERLSRVRIEKANDLLSFWAYAHWAYQNRVEVKVGYTGGCILTEFQGGKEYKPFCFKKKTNGKETRQKLGSRIPIGGSVDVNTKLDRAIRIDEIFQENFSVRQLTLLWALYIPPIVYGAEKRLTDAKIARVLGFKPSWACQVKYKSVELVVLELFSPKVAV